MLLKHRCELHLLTQMADRLNTDSVWSLSLTLIRLGAAVSATTHMNPNNQMDQFIFLLYVMHMPDLIV